MKAHSLTQTLNIMDQLKVDSLTSPMTDGTKSSVTNGCRLCGKPTIRNESGLCYNHYRESRISEWLDNTDIHNLGIVRWAKELLPEYVFNDTPEFHKELYHSLLSLYDPSLRNKYERLRAFISYRGSAKSTAANTLFVMYVIAHNDKQFNITINDEIKTCTIYERAIVLISETAGSAEEFSVRIRDTFSSSERIRYYYNYAIADAIDSITGQWTRSAFKINNTYVQAVGSGQQIRGKVKGFSRVTLAIGDDIYSENNTITEDRRYRIRNWWNNAVMNSIDDLRGKAILLGTILHEDTVLVDTERNPRWRVTKIPVMPIDLFHKFINEHIRVDWNTGTCVLPHDEVEDENKRSSLQRQYFDKVQTSSDWGLSWPSRLDLFFLAIKYQEAVYNGTVSGLYQEYFHITVSPHERRFKREYFQALENYRLDFEYGYSWLLLDGNSDRKICNLEFGVDIAGTGTDDAVITVAATTPDMKIYVLHQAIGKFSIRDNIDSPNRYSKVMLDRAHIQGVGLVDEVFRLALRYKPSKIKVGTAGEEELIVREMRRVFEENRNYVPIVARPQVGGVNAVRKEDRIKNTLLPYYETRIVYHAPHLEKLEYQLEYLGKTAHDDCADSLEVALYGIEFPQELSYSFFTPKVNFNNRFDPYLGNSPRSSLAEDWRWL